MENPLIFAIIGFVNIFIKFGISFSMTLSRPGFCKPTALSIPLAVSAIRGVSLPSLGSKVMPLMEMEPNLFKSYKSAYSCP